MKRWIVWVVAGLWSATAVARNSGGGDSFAAAGSAVVRPEAVDSSDRKPAGGEGAHLHLERTAYDFGDVPRKGGDLVHEFGFTNDGTAPLVILRVATSCSCLKATFPKRPVAPGESGVIRIVYEPHKSEPGTFNKVIRVYSNSADGRELITVQGNSIEGPGR